VKSTEGKLVVVATDRGDTPLSGACFVLEVDNELVTRVCDKDDEQDDGTTTFEAVPAGNYTLKEEEPPSGYQPVKERQVSIRAERTKKITAKHRPAPPAEVETTEEDGGGEPTEAAASINADSLIWASKQPLVAEAILAAKPRTRQKAIRSGRRNSW
jgi:hypothetical protein